MSWLDDYLDYTAAQESPEEFHLFSGLTVIASVLNRQVWLPRTTRDGIERYRVYPGQLATVLVADSGFLRKTTAVDIAHDFMKAANVRLFEGKISHERLLKKLGSFKDGRAVLTVVSGELEHFISKSAYHDGLIGSLTKLFDCKDDAYETNVGGLITLKNVCFTFLGATNPKSIGNALPSQAQEQGFKSRWLYVYADHTDKQPDPLTTDANGVPMARVQKSFAARNTLVSALNNFSRLQGPARLRPEAVEWFNDWYAIYSKGKAVNQPGWPARRGDHLLRLALLLEVSATSGLDVSSGSLMAADELLTKFIESKFDATFAFIGRHANADQQDRVLEFFVANQNGSSLRLSDVVYSTRRYFKSFTELHETLEFLKRAGMLKFEGLDSHTLEEYWRLVRI